ncbi:MAG TPA: flagellar hook-basal body complex protein FliE [Ramlibacter sp.]|nr:flagellar hook-basal body complex protein FliE [Ramlibacter sp.]
MNGIAPVDEVAPQILGGIPSLAARANADAASAAGGFGEIFSQGLTKVNEALVTGQTDLQRLATGDVENLHQLMIKMEESRLSFQLMLQVRNRLLEAYQDVMKMQI